MTKILVLEDEPNVRRVATVFLERMGYEVVAVCNGEEAITRSQEFRPDLLLADVTIVGGMGGIQASRILRDLFPGLKVIMMSGYIDLPEIGEVDSFLPKPFTIQELREAVTQVLE